MELSRQTDPRHILCFNTAAWWNYLVRRTHGTFFVLLQFNRSTAGPFEASRRAITSQNENFSEPASCVHTAGDTNTLPRVLFNDNQTLIL
jgi:hypothetical protein